MRGAEQPERVSPVPFTLRFRRGARLSGRSGPVGSRVAPVRQPGAVQCEGKKGLQGGVNTACIVDGGVAKVFIVLKCSSVVSFYTWLPRGWDEVPNSKTTWPLRMQ